jgi:NMD protein affecting ribosome stability and mRNA decay
MAARKQRPCPNCGTTKGEFGLASGLCMKCSDESVEALIAVVRRTASRRPSVVEDIYTKARRAIAEKLDGGK